MRDNFRPNVRLTTNILMVFGTFLIAFNLSKISTLDRAQQINEDCARVVVKASTEEEFIKKYNLKIDQKTPARIVREFCSMIYGK